MAPSSEGLAVCGISTDGRVAISLPSITPSLYFQSLAVPGHGACGLAVKGGATSYELPCNLNDRLCSLHDFLDSRKENRRRQVGITS